MNVELKGTIARYNRLSLISEAESFGFDIPPEATAPFNVIWDPNMKKAFVCLEKVRLAELKTESRYAAGQRTNVPILDIRKEVRPEYHRYIVRAVESAADVTDEVGKAKRSMDREKKSKVKNNDPLTTNGYQQPYRIELPMSDVAKGLLGAESIEERLSLSNFFNGGITISIAGSGVSSFTLQQVDGGSACRYNGGHGVAMKEERLKNLIQSGLEVWNKSYNKEGMEKALEKLLSYPDLDIDSIDDAYLHARALDNIPYPGASVKIGPLSYDHRALGKSEHVIMGIRCNGIRVFDINFNHSGFPDKMMKEANERLATLRMVKSLGGHPREYQVPTDEMIREAVEKADFGYF